MSSLRKWLLKCNLEDKSMLNKRREQNVEKPSKDSKSGGGRWGGYTYQRSGGRLVGLCCYSCTPITFIMFTNYDMFLEGNVLRFSTFECFFFFFESGLISLCISLCIASPDSLSCVENKLGENKYRGRKKIWITSMLHLSSKKKSQNLYFPLTWAATLQSRCILMRPLIRAFLVLDH